ncbi:hypothetical protein PR048_025809 [Dryococelus australis]|uniref:Uncharacterized protein n=1 Tax=Dryococelus australis TaxID=614101 RepID=A0ABQ9GJK7_9NEOP|nr:hypothetical protein PR048_025809 [Dryococelus australis]
MGGEQSNRSVTTTPRAWEVTVLLPAKVLWAFYTKTANPGKLQKRRPFLLITRRLRLGKPSPGGAKHHASEEIWAAPNFEVLIVDDGEPECKGRGKREIPAKTRRPAASSATIPTCEIPGADTPPLRNRTRFTLLNTGGPFHNSGCNLTNSDALQADDTPVQYIERAEHPHTTFENSTLLPESECRVPLRKYGATVAERLDNSPPTEANGVQSPAGSLRIFASRNRAGRCRWSAGFLGNLPFSPPFNSGAVPFSPHFTFIGSQDLAVKSRPNLFFLRIRKYLSSVYMGLLALGSGIGPVHSRAGLRDLDGPAQLLWKHSPGGRVTRPGLRLYKTGTMAARCHLDPVARLKEDHKARGLESMPTSSRRRGGLPVSDYETVQGN